MSAGEEERSGRRAEAERLDRGELEGALRQIAARGGDRATRLRFLDVALEAAGRAGRPLPTWHAELRARVERGEL